MSARSPRHLRYVFVIAGVVLVAAFILRIGVDNVVAQLMRVGPEALLILVPYLLGTALGAYPWAWLLPSAVRPTDKGIILSRFAASGANALLPFFGLAGEPSRLLWLPAPARAGGLSAIVLDRVLYNTASAILLLCGAVIGLWTKLPTIVCAGAAATALVIVLITALAAFTVARFGMGQRLQKLLHKFLGDSYAQAEFGAQVDSSLRGLLTGPRAVLWRGLFVHFVGRALLAAEILVALWSLNATATLADACVLATVPIATALFASSIPSQIGVQEGAQAVTCAALGLDPALGLTLVFLQRLRQLVVIPLTPVLIAVAEAPRESRA